MENNPVYISILGCRGSVPVSGGQFSRYGGATCCVAIRTESAAAVLDAGTGLMDLSHRLNGEKQIHLFLTHCHIDHILGLPLCPAVLSSQYEFHIYGADRDGLSISSQIRTLMSPPLWPVAPEQLPAKLTFHPILPKMDANGMLIETMEGCHPGGVTVYRLTVNERRIVYMTDCTITDENHAALLEFCKNCDLLLCDGQYSDEQWLTRSAFGHNRWTQAARFAQECGAKKARILHHDPAHSDSILDRARDEVRAISPICDLAFEREEIIL